MSRGKGVKMDTRASLTEAVAEESPSVPVYVYEEVRDGTGSPNEFIKGQNSHANSWQRAAAEQGHKYEPAKVAQLYDNGTDRKADEGGYKGFIHALIDVLKGYPGSDSEFPTDLFTRLRDGLVDDDLAVLYEHRMSSVGAYRSGWSRAASTYEKAFSGGV